MTCFGVFKNYNKTNQTKASRGTNCLCLCSICTWPCILLCSHILWSGNYWFRVSYVLVLIVLVIDVVVEESWNFCFNLLNILQGGCLCQELGLLSNMLNILECVDTWKFELLEDLSKKKVPLIFTVFKIQI